MDLVLWVFFLPLFDLWGFDIQLELVTEVALLRVDWHVISLILLVLLLVLVLVDWNRDQRVLGRLDEQQHIILGRLLRDPFFQQISFVLVDAHQVLL